MIDTVDNNIVKRALRLLSYLDEKAESASAGSPSRYLDDSSGGHQKNKVRRPRYTVLVEAKIDLELAVKRYLRAANSENRSLLLSSLIYAQQISR